MLTKQQRHQDPGGPRLPMRYQAAFALIHSDQHMAWRGAELVLHPLDLLDRIGGVV